MAAVVTDQFRILNASNFIDSVIDSNNSYYVFLGLASPSSPSVGFGRSSDWDSNTPSPYDNLSYSTHYRDTALFGKKISGSSIRRVIRKVTWTTNTRYDMYRHDYNAADNVAPNSQLGRLYDSNYYVINSDYRIYICLDNGSSGSNLKGDVSLNEPTSTDLEPVTLADGYTWKYLYSISPSDVIKFDSTEYISVPNDWTTTSDVAIQTIRDGADSSVNNNQIRVVYINSVGSGYVDGTYTNLDILGDGSGGKVTVTVSGGSVSSVVVTAGGKDYTYGVIDLSQAHPPSASSLSNPAKLIPIIPPSRGHGYDVYSELGCDKILIYSRFDDSTRDFPVDTQFAQVGILKNPKEFSSGITTFTGSEYSSLYAVKLTSAFTATPSKGEKITQTYTSGGVSVTAKGYVASYDSETNVLKYFQDRSLYFNNSYDQTDYIGVSVGSKVVPFVSTANIEFASSGTASIDTSLNDNKVTIGSKVINLGVTFSSGLANPEINKNTGDLIYIDNRSLVERDVRQKEDIKIILEF